MKKKIKTIQATNGKFDRVGSRISLENFRGRIRLRWQYQLQSFSVTINGGITQTSIDVAYAKANAIAADISLDRFDPSLAKYDPHRTRAREKPEPNSICDLWEAYKKREENRAAHSTKTIWKEIDRALTEISSDALTVDNLEKFVAEYLKVRSLGTCHRHAIAIQAAIRAKFPKISLKKLFPKMAKKPVEWFSPEEVREILSAFEMDTYASPSASDKHSFYYPYVAFLAYTGCRPEEALALAWDDIYWTPKCEISISKAYTKGHLSQYTKNHLNRRVPIPKKLQDILGSLPRKTEQVFYSPRANKILDHKGFSRRNWRPILLRLVAEGKIRKYLRPYCLRHSYVNNLHYVHGVPLSEIANLVGDRVETVLRYYTGIKIPEHIPDLY
ncbi:tyrosine-type recombinase/integrase [Roseofilum casamattae]|uniref:Tyrosine-type recombinase/integrase n=1 Tax=Roseofilum casamattae BLCC-M143 TaxID=3022442 RepID=A0ABT7C4Z3_9CYAN|nr:tyrosine-type recombinase/integrase [Roseofilum casamattae]MDJ1185888.1 tyrosine-type recombinase/integrase [Roseofilum casamattae BLCC-M143]